ncbi:MAG: ribosome recycling factor [Bacillota bacterium]
MNHEVIAEGAKRMSKQVEFFRKEMATIRAGRANPALVNDLMVDYYGSATPLKQIASIGAPEARLLVIEPWDKNAIGDIEKAIMRSDLGIMPSNDGNVIRLAIPQLTEERRRELVQLANKRAEESRVAIRNIRRDINDEIKQLDKDGDVSEDEARRLLDRSQEITDEHIALIDGIMEEKESEIMEV